MAESDLKSEIFKKSKRNFTLIDFDKVDAINKTVLGQETYIVKYKAELEVLNTVYTVINRIPGKRLFFNFKAYKKIPSDYFPSFQSQMTEVIKGDKFKFEGELYYLKSESGWVKTKSPFEL